MLRPTKRIELAELATYAEAKSRELIELATIEECERRQLDLVQASRDYRRIAREKRMEAYRVTVTDDSSI